MSLATDTYARFLTFIRDYNQKERIDNNRRMFSVFIWCFFAPAFLSATLLVLINYGIFPRSLRGYLDWLILIFPILYSLYFLGSQVLVRAPKDFRQGGLATTLGQSLRDASWRIDTCEAMKRDLKFQSSEWRFVITHFEEDLERLQLRTRYLTGLAGAVFFLVMQGIDSITADPAVPVDVRESLFAKVMNPPSASSSEWVGLALFLVLLYLSGSQTVQVLRRYLVCARMLRDGTSNP